MKKILLLLCFLVVGCGIFDGRTFKRNVAGSPIEVTVYSGAAHSTIVCRDTRTGCEYLECKVKLEGTCGKL